MDDRDISRRPISPLFARRPSLEAASPNERLILDLLRRERGASRADLSRITGLTNQSLSRIIDDLGGRGLVKLGPSLPKGRGPPSSPVIICPDGAYTIGVSLMTDAIAIGLMDFDGQIVCDRIAPLNAADVEAVLGEVRHFIDQVFSERGLNRDRLLGVGVGITGYFIGEGAKVNPPAQIDSWALIDVVEVFERGLNLPVWMDNDGNVAAVGESLSGVGVDLRSFAYLFFSAGFGGGLIFDRKLYRGIHGNAGEFASILTFDVMSPNLENLRLSVNRAGHRFDNLAAMLQDFDPDWPGVAEWIEPAVGALNTVISAISAIVDVEAIVLGGRLPGALAERLIPRLSYVNPERRKHHRPVPKILVSAVTQDAAMIGAASLPLKALFYG